MRSDLVRSCPFGDWLSIAVLTSAVVACTTAELATPAGEARLGAAEAAEVERQIGLVEAPSIASYVDAIGHRLVKGSEIRSDVTYRFHLVEMIEPNAFALPGGYIYISRGLLPIANSEDELAGVIAHEIGHVAAKHHLRHAVREAPLVPVRLALGIGGVATSVISPGLGRLVGAIGNAPGSLYLASYGRSQENEADAIGQQLLAKAGWDPGAMASVMDALARESALEGRDPDQLSFFDTHPTAPSRARRTRERAATLRVVPAARIAANRRDFYQRIDGLLYGESAANGVVVENEFLHRDLDLRVAFPAGWQIVNGAEAVVAVPKQGDALAAFTIAANGDDPVAVAKQVIANSAAKLEGEIEAIQIGRLPAARATVTTREGFATRLHHLVTWIAHGGNVYGLAGTTRVGDWQHHRSALADVVVSFRPLERTDRNRIREAHVRVVDAKQGEKLEQVLARVDSAWSPERTAAANDLAPDQPLRGGQPLKVARWEIYAPEASGR
jgi:predicted Zn-dependent protease